MTETFADGAFEQPVRKRLCGIARLGKREQRKRLQGDTRQWLATGHHIEQLPPGPNTAAGKLDTFSNLLIETGFLYEL